MCEKEKRIKELEADKHELEKLLSEITKNKREAEKLHSERKYNYIRTQFHVAQVLAVPIMIGLLGVIIAILK